MVGALIGFTDIARKALILPSFGATASGRVGQGSNSPNFVHAHCCAPQRDARFAGWMITYVPLGRARRRRLVRAPLPRPLPLLAGCQECWSSARASHSCSRAITFAACEWIVSLRSLDRAATQSERLDLGPGQ